MALTRINELAAQALGEAKKELAELSNRLPFETNDDGKPTKTRQKPSLEHKRGILKDAVDNIADHSINAALRDDLLDELERK
jgi:hypothetical protein